MYVYISFFVLSIGVYSDASLRATKLYKKMLTAKHMYIKICSFSIVMHISVLIVSEKKKVKVVWIHCMSRNVYIFSLARSTSMRSHDAERCSKRQSAELMCDVVHCYHNVSESRHYLGVKYLTTYIHHFTSNVVEQVFDQRLYAVVIAFYNNKHRWAKRSATVQAFFPVPERLYITCE